MNISCKNLIKQFLKDKKMAVEFKVGEDTYYVFRGLSIPFLVMNSILVGNLCVLSNRCSRYLTLEAMSEWATPSGLRQLLNKLKRYSLEEYTEDDSKVGLRIIDIREIFSEIDFGDIIRSLKCEILNDMEFADVPIIDGMDEDEIDKLFSMESKKIYDAYSERVMVFKDYLPQSTIDLILSKIKIN